MNFGLGSALVVAFVMALVVVLAVLLQAEMRASTDHFLDLQVVVVFLE